MNSFVVFTLFLVAAVNAGDDLSPEFKEKLFEKMQTEGMKCAKDSDANGDDIGQLMSRQIPTRREGKCLISCVNKVFGVQDKEGKFSRDGIVKALQPFKKESEDVFGKLMKLFDTCLPAVKATDACDAAAEMSTCSNAQADKLGVTADMFM